MTGVLELGTATEVITHPLVLFKNMVSWVPPFAYAVTKFMAIVYSNINIQIVLNIPTINKQGPLCKALGAQLQNLDVAYRGIVLLVACTNPRNK